jgi:hypothetical protein
MHIIDQWRTYSAKLRIGVVVNHCFFLAYANSFKLEIRDKCFNLGLGLLAGHLNSVRSLQRKIMISRKDKIPRFRRRLHFDSH